MKDELLNKGNYCDFCIHFTVNKNDNICGCSLLIWWNENRIGKMGEIDNEHKWIGFVKPSKCTNMKLK